MPLCKCCDRPASFLGSLDFNKTCEDHKRGRVFPKFGPAVRYHRCHFCGFIFTDFCDDWTPADFSERIYNDEYGRADPDFLSGGRAQIADQVAAALSPSREGLRLLDYGAGGDPGHLGRRMIALGFDVTSYDPFYAASSPPRGPFDVVFSVEVIEHCHRPRDVAQEMADLIGHKGLLWISTALHPPVAGSEVLASWYIAPRNGHISVFTLPALTILFRNVGVTIMQSSHGLVGFRQLPGFPNQAFA